MAECGAWRTAHGSWTCIRRHVAKALTWRLVLVRQDHGLGDEVVSIEASNVEWPAVNLKLRTSTTSALKTLAWSKNHSCLLTELL